jgi:hypothetical protein
MIYEVLPRVVDTMRSGEDFGFLILGNSPFVVPKIAKNWQPMLITLQDCEMVELNSKSPIAVDFVTDITHKEQVAIK